MTVASTSHCRLDCFIYKSRLLQTYHSLAVETQQYQSGSLYRTDSLGACQKLKIRYPLIPIIAQTAYATHEEKEKAMEAGCNDYLTKPIRKDELFAMIEKYYVNP